MEGCRTVLESLIFIGVLLTQWDMIRGAAKGILRRVRLRRSLRSIGGGRQSREYGRVRTYLSNLLESTGTEKIFGSPDHLIAASALLGGGMYFVTVFSEGWRVSLAFALLCTTLPFLFLRMRLSMFRRARSKEGTVMMQELLAQYRIRDCNIREAVFAAAEGLEDAPFMRAVLYDLAKGLNRAYTRTECRRELDKFRYAIGTTWGNALATAMYYAHVQGICITDAMEDLSKSLERSRKVCEISRREQHESRLLLLLAVPGTYVWTLFCACRYFDMTLAGFLHYQFRTPLGLRCFLIAAMLYIAGFACQVFFSGDKLDLR